MIWSSAAGDMVSSIFVYSPTAPVVGGLEEVVESEQLLVPVIAVAPGAERASMPPGSPLAPPAHLLSVQSQHRATQLAQRGPET